MPHRIARVLLSLALVATACSSSSGRDEARTSLVVAGDVLCEQLFKVNATYVAGGQPTVDGLLQAGGRLLPAFKKLDPPEGDDRWTAPLAKRWSAVVSAAGIGEALVAPLWQFVGAARVSGLWICGSEAALTPAPEPSGATIDPADYAARVRTIIDATAAEHQTYHERPDPAELSERIQPGVADSHGPGYLAIEDRIIKGVAALPPPTGQAAEAAAFLGLLREARAAEAKGIAQGGEAGDTVYELGFFSTSQAIGIACVVWSLDLCD